jgi:hypothetical protein
MNSQSFKALVRTILNEEIQKKRVPEMNGNGVNPDKSEKTFSSDPNSRDSKTKEEMLSQIRKAVDGVDKSFTCVWDDHDDITINGRDKTSLKITPLWEDNYKLVYMPRNEDRLFFSGFTWKQVIDFVKNNLNQDEHTGVEKARDKSWRNSEDQTKSEKDLPKGQKLKVKTVGDSKNKEKDYNEKEVKNDADLPDAPLKEVDGFKRTSEYKVQDPVKLRKRNPDTKLIVKQK